MGAAHLSACCGPTPGQRAADVRRYGVSSCCTPSRSLANWYALPCEDHSPAHASKPRDARHLDRGTTRRYSRALAPRQGPSGPPKKLSLLIVPTFPSCFCAHRTPHLTPVRRFPSAFGHMWRLPSRRLRNGVNGFTLQVIAFSLKLNLPVNSCKEFGPGRGGISKDLRKWGRTRYHQ